MKYEEIEEDLIRLSLEGMFDVIVHGCNCFCTMNKGIAAGMRIVFDCNLFPLEAADHKGDYNKLGQIEYRNYVLLEGRAVLGCGPNLKSIAVVNAYTQYMYKKRDDGVDCHLDYTALILCLRKINHEFKGKHIGLPLIGAGLAGGNWNLIRLHIQNELRDCDVTVVRYKP